MRTLEVVLTIVALLSVLGMFVFNLWIGANFSKGLTLPQCYVPLNYLATAFVLFAATTVLIRK